MMRPTLALARLTVFLYRKHDKLLCASIAPAAFARTKKAKKTTAGVNPPTVNKVAKSKNPRPAVKQRGLVS